MDANITAPHGPIWRGATVLVRDAITRAADLAAVAETEIVRAHAGLSKLALALEASRTMRVQTIDLVIAARELRRAAGGPS
jgi:hypothetical protein